MNKSHRRIGTNSGERSAGTIFLPNSKVQKIGNRKESKDTWDIGVPHGFYKIIIDPDTNQSVSFLFDHSGDVPGGCSLDSELKQCIVGVDEIEELSGLDFFNGSNQNQIHVLKKKNISHWNKLKAEYSL